MTRAIRIDGDIAYVPLTKGYEAVIDVADVPLVASYNWFAHVSRRTVYAFRTDCSGGGRRTIFMHRILMGEPDGLCVDHRDGNGLNNRRTNLRGATVSQNACNQRLTKRNTSGFKGVSWDKCTGKWHARIRLGGSTVWSKLFDSIEAAAAAQAEKIAELHGEFGRVA